LIPKAEETWGVQERDGFVKPEKARGLVLKSIILLLLLLLLLLL
jgi:hypothetical protein